MAELITEIAEGRLKMTSQGFQAQVPFEDGSSLLSKGGRAAYRICLDMLNKNIQAGLGQSIDPVPKRRGPASLHMKIKAAREVRVFLDPDYSTESPHLWTVRISKPQAIALLGRAGDTTKIVGNLDAHGILVLYPDGPTQS